DSPRKLQPGNGNVDAVYGTVVTIHAAADRPLARAWVDFQPVAAEVPAGLAMAMFGTPGPLGMAGRTALVGNGLGRIQAKFEENRRNFSFRFLPSLHGSYTIHMEDESGLISHHQYEMRLKPDPVPEVKLLRPTSGKDQLNVVATAEVPLHITADDPHYAVRTMWLEYRVGPEGEPRRLPMYDYRRGLALDAAGWMGAFARVAPVPRLRLQHVEAERMLSLKQLRNDASGLLQPGDV